MNVPEETFVALVLPTGDLVHTDFAMSLVNLCVHTVASGVSFVIANSRSSSIVKSRNIGVEAALAVPGVTHLCFIDSDQIFPAFTLQTLLAHDKDIISVASVCRQFPVRFTAKDADDHDIDFCNLDGLLPVKSNGFSFMLIKREVFEKMKFPWFQSHYTINPGKPAEEREFVSEDEFFCEGAYAYGYEVLIDCGLTHHIRHVGQYRFGPSDIAEIIVKKAIIAATTEEIKHVNSN